MNSYELSRNWFDWSFENPEKINPNHSALYFFTIEHCNRLGWKEKFGLPTTMAKESIGIRSYNTYIKTLNDLVDFGFIKLIEKSKNQYSSNIIALSNFNKATGKALDKAIIKHETKQDESIDSINKQETINKETTIPIEDPTQGGMQGGIEAPTVQEKEKEKEQLYIVSFQERVNKFLIWFNSEFTKHGKQQAKFRTLNNQTESNLKKLLDKYLTDEWSVAFENMINNSWVIENKNATPDHFLRPANFDKYLNQGSKEKEPNKFAWA